MFKLRLEHIKLAYDKKVILNDISLEVNPGEIMGIIGANGSGKSTLIRGITKYINPVSGDIYIDGDNIRKISSHNLAQIIASVPQNTNLPDLFTAFELALMGRTPHLGLFRYEGKKDFEIVNKAMEATNTLHLADRYMKEISGGERQRIVIARALVQEPRILILDEPTSHLDINSQTETMDMVYSLSREMNLIVLITLHDLNLAAQYCDRIAILHQGKILKQGTPSEVISSEIIKQVYGADVCVYPHPVNNLPTTVITPHKNGNGNKRQ
jgi:iron complex transport system ATP-binding protein